MELFRNIRMKTGKSILSKRMDKTKRKVFYSDFSQVKSIGIVWDASNTGDFAGLSRFYQKMHEKSIDVKILGYFGGKELPDQYTAIRYLTCFRKKELNFFYHPSSFEVDHFIRNRFDILIDINFERIIPLEFVSSLSKSSFKVGLFESEKNNCDFDLMMEIKKPIDIDHYLNQVVYYLEMIKSGTSKTEKTFKN
jgi:hypothetical protein